MIEIYIDGALVHSTAADDDAYTALNVKPSLDIEDSGSLSFVLPPGNAQYDAIRKMKSIVTLYQDGVLLFRGRVTESERDNFNQKTVHCEGDRAFLNDSLWEEQTFSGTAADLFRQLIANHNSQVDSGKRFTVGSITAVESYTTIEDEQQINTRRLTDTASVIEDRLLSMFGGYIRTRTQGGVTYIDWLKDFTEESSQTISFSVNLLDLTEKMDASDVFTVLIPLGYSEIGEDGTYEDPVNITSVNGGKEYIENAEAVALYGRIWRSKTWGSTKDPAQLLEKGREYLRTGLELRTLEIKAVDMHLSDEQTQMIRIGTRVHIQSIPHGINLKMVCAKIEPDYDRPENTMFTFGVKPKTLTEAVIRNEKETNNLSGKGRGGGGRSVKEEMGDIYRWAKINVNEAMANINLNAGEIDNLTGRITTAEIDIDGLNAEILLKASQKTVDELGERVTSAEIAIDGANANILLKADASTVTALGNRVSSAEIKIDGMNSEILLKANKVYVDAEITSVKTLIADEIEAMKADIELAIADEIRTGAITCGGLAAVGSLSTSNATIGALTLGTDSISKTTIPVVTSFTQALGESAPTRQVTLLTVA